MDLASARIALDPEAVVPAIAAIPALRDQPPQRAEFTALWVKPGRHCHAAYAVTCDGVSTPRLASACGIGNRRAAALVEALGPHREHASICPHCSVAVTAPGVLTQLFPVDYRLPTLPVCLDSERVTRALPSEWRVRRAEPVGYRPGMRCQIRYETDRGVLYGKVAVERELGGAFARHLQIARACAATGGRVRVAQPFMYVPDLQLTVICAVAGESLYDALHRSADLGASIGRAAGALADFHRLQVSAVPRVYGVADELALVESWTALVARWFPPLSSDLHRALAALRRDQLDSVAPRAFVHRDFYDKQILVADDGIMLLDLDTACHGDPEIDVGNFCAQLVLRGLQLDRVSACAGYAAAFIDAFPAPLALDRVQWYRRAALLRLACGYALRPRWRRLAPALLAQVFP